MASVAEWSSFGASAHANMVVRFGGSEFQGRVRSAFVGSVAEGLVFGEAACAIVVLLAYFELHS